MPRAAESPTRNPVKLPGPTETAILSMEPNPPSTFAITRSISGINASACPRSISRLSDAIKISVALSITPAEHSPNAVSMAKIRKTAP